MSTAGRQGDAKPSPEAIAREQAAAKSKGSARMRAVGSYFLGGIAGWKLVVQDLAGADLAVWLAVFAFAFGLASLDQILKALGKG